MLLKPGRTVGFGPNAPGGPIAVWHNDQPPCYASDQPFLAVARACRRDGVKVVLTGEGADELFGGYPWQINAYHIWRRRKWQTRFRQFFSKILTPFSLLDSVTMEKITFARFPTPEPYNKLQTLREATVEDGAQRILRYEALFEKLKRIKPIENRALLAVCLNDMYGHVGNLLHRNDRMGMAASIESRVPFLDNHLINFAIHLPAKCKYQKRIQKWVVRSAARSYLPSDIVHAPKIGFSTSYYPYKFAVPLIRSGLTPDIFGWSSKATETLLEKLAEEPTVLFTLIGVELWARIFLRGETPGQLGEELVCNASQASII